jgi:hypothetical protein
MINFRRSGNLDAKAAPPPKRVQTQTVANSSNATAPAAPQKWLDKVRSFKIPKDRDWKLSLVVVACEIVLILVCRDWLWPLLWGFFGVWLIIFNLAGVAVYVFCREPKDKKKPDDGKKLSAVGKLILGTVLVVFVVNHIGGQTVADKAALVKRVLSSHNLFGDSLPEENESMRNAVKKFWQDSLPDDSLGRQRMLAIASETRFNQVDDAGRTLRPEVGGRYKIGVMSIDQRLWSWAGIGSGKDISLPDGDDNLAGALYLYKKFKTLAWTWPSRIGPRSIRIPVSADGWTDFVHTSRTPYLYTSGKISIREKGSNTEYSYDENQRLILPPAEALQFRSLSGQPEIVVLNN